MNDEFKSQSFLPSLNLNLKIGGQTDFFRLELGYTCILKKINRYECALPLGMLRFTKNYPKIEKFECL